MKVLDILFPIKTLNIYLFIFMFSILISIKIFPQESLSQYNIAGEFFYKEGEKLIKIYLIEDMVVELGKNPYIINNLDPSSTLIVKKGIVHLYKIQNKFLKKEIKEKNFTKKWNQDSQSSISEVFISESGTILALPGRIIISFKENVDTKTIENFLNKRELTIIRTNNLGNKKYYILQYKPGIPALELANELSNETIVEYCQPDWWKEFSLR